MIRAVIDTNVIFEGLTKRNSPGALILRAWQRKLFRPYISLALYYEYHDVLARKLSSQRWQRVKPALHTLIKTATPVTPHFIWRPISQDPGDDFLIDCAMNAKAWVVTYNFRDFTLARSELGLIVLMPREFLSELSE